MDDIRPISTTTNRVRYLVNGRDNLTFGNETFQIGDGHITNPYRFCLSCLEEFLHFPPGVYVAPFIFVEEVAVSIWEEGKLLCGGGLRDWPVH